MAAAEYLRYFLQRLVTERMGQREERQSPSGHCAAHCDSAEQKKNKKEKRVIKKKKKEATWTFQESLFTSFSVLDRRINKWLGLHCHHWLLGGVLLLNLLEASTKKESERV